jgi:hypothetical protein
MPLARIFTHHPERTTVLAEQLQQQGYRVEVLSPNQTNLAPADLEIEFDICERADVLEHAASLADELQADVAVAPGVLQPEVKPAVETPVTAEPLRAEAVTQIAAEQEQEHDREREFEAAFQPAQREWEPAAQSDLQAEEQAPQVIEFPVMEQAPLPPVAIVEEPPVMKSEPAMAEAARQAEPVPYLAQLTPFGTPQEESTQRFSDAESQRQMQTEATGHASDEPGMGKRAADFLGKSMAAMKVGIAETAESFREHLKEYKKRAQVRSAEARAARVARMLDLEQRQAEAQQRATELEAAREAAAARLMELLRQRDPGLREENARAEVLREELLREEALYQAREPQAQAEASSRRKPLAALRHFSIARLLKRPSQPMSPQLRAVLTGAAAVTVLFVIGIILGSLYPRGPLASTTSRPGSSSGVTVQTGGVTLKAGTPAANPAPAGNSAQAASTKTQPTAQQASTSSTAASSQDATTVKPSPRGAQTRRQIAQQNGEDEIGDDVVIRHFNRPVPTQKPNQSGQQAGLKHFSDMEN